MKKIPISLIIDDPAPVISVYHEHAKSRTTKDGRPLIPTFPNTMLLDFCDIIERHGMKGKFSVVPMPGNKGDIVRGLDGVDQRVVDEWLDIVKRRVIPAFTVGPEVLTHHKAVGHWISARTNGRFCRTAPRSRHTSHARFPFYGKWALKPSD